MKTPYNEIVNIASIGSQTNPISLNEILRKANDEQLTPAAQNKERVLFLGIDVQQDFMDNGALGVPGAHGDVERMTQFIYNNMDKITNIAVSIDTHTPHQIIRAGGLMKMATIRLLTHRLRWQTLILESTKLLSTLARAVTM